MSLFGRLFGGAVKPAPEPEMYKGFAITPASQKESGGWRLGARIEKDGQSVDVIRADVLNAQDAADDAGVAKAKQMIDEQGDNVFR